jgi:hypothetical protein
VTSNELRIPFAEWLFRMSEARLAPQARELAVYAVVFKVTSNEELARLAGMDTIVKGESIADKTYNRWKKQLTDQGFVILKATTVGRVTTIEVFPAIGALPVTFTDLKARDIRKFYDRNGQSKSYGRDVDDTDDEQRPDVTVTADERNSYGNSVEPTAVSRAPTPAQMESLRDSYSSESEVKSPPTPQQASGLRDGEEEVSPGVFVNCETIRHEKFTISIPAIYMQLLGVVPKDEIKQIALGHAVSWANILASGKRVPNVPPNNPDNFIRASIKRQHNDDAVTDVRKKRAAGPSATEKPKETELQRLQRLMGGNTNVPEQRRLT